MRDTAQDVSNTDIAIDGMVLHIPPVGQFMQVSGPVNIDPNELFIKTTGSGLSVSSPKFKLNPGQWLHLALVFGAENTISCSGSMSNPVAEGPVSDVQCFTRIGCDPQIATTSYLTRPEETVTYEGGEIPYAIYIAIRIKAGPFQVCNANLDGYTISFGPGTLTRRQVPDDRHNDKRRRGSVSTGHRVQRDD